MEIINVGLYGGKGLFGGKETPLTARIVSCDKYEKCSYYKKSECLGITNAFSSNCKYANKSSVRGYTTRAKKYYTFKSKYTEHEKYNALERAQDKLGVIDNVVVLPYPYLKINDDLSFSREVYGGDDIHYIPIEKFDVEFIHELVTFMPYALFGGVISSYQNEVVPKILTHLQEELPELYKKFKKKYPKHCKDINYVGRKALIKTLEPCEVKYKSDRYPDLNSDWFWDGKFLIYRSGYISKVNVVKEYEVAGFKLLPNDNAVITITDNKQVGKKTKFKD